MEKDIPSFASLTSLAVKRLGSERTRLAQTRRRSEGDLIGEEGVVKALEGGVNMGEGGGGDIQSGHLAELTEVCDVW